MITASIEESSMMRRRSGSCCGDLPVRASSSPARSRMRFSSGSHTVATSMPSSAATIFITLPPRPPIPMTATRRRSFAPAQLCDVPSIDAAPRAAEEVRKVRRSMVFMRASLETLENRRRVVNTCLRLGRRAPGGRAEWFTIPAGNGVFQSAGKGAGYGKTDLR